ncbi:NADH dehydrogenase (ubiquinone) complex I, assembly factor 6-like [Halichondria panicea]|uniref:NADH dehydrogenase (ubiquinone) complex I, assembly factor 6-like n=1 Tax=Halichondria panicea TaxID=6063 RepID=UPI00312B47FB
MKLVNGVQCYSRFPQFVCFLRQWNTRTSSTSSNNSYCIQSVRKHDYDHYLCCLLLPKSSQASAFSIRAFNIEIAQIQNQVSEQSIGKMRLQFWKDALNNIYKGAPPLHPVALALAEAVGKHKLTKKWLTRVVEARDSTQTRLFRSTEELETYAEHTFSSLLYLTLETLGVRDVNSDHAASHVGKAEGIVTLLRASNFYRASRHVPIPMDIMIRHGASQEDFIRGQLSQPLQDSVYDFASLAHTHLNKAHSLRNSIPSDGWRALLPAVVCESLLKRIQQADFDPFSPQLMTRPPLLPLQLLWKRLSRTF